MSSLTNPLNALEALLAARRSVRGFVRDRPVACDVIRHALQLAQRSPSNCNAQPWQIFVVGGERCERLRAALSAAAKAQGVNVTPHFVGVHRERQIACAVELYSHIGVARGDRDGRTRAFERNFALFDAPHVAILTMHASFGVQVALDVGCWLMSFLLALQASGVQSCAQASLTAYPDVLRHELDIPSELQILCAVSFGYEDEGAAANQTRQPRAPLAENVTLLGFE